VPGGKTARHGFPEFRNSGHRGVVSLPLLQPLDTGVDDWSRRIEIRFSDFQVNNVAALPLQFVGPGERFKRRLALDSDHPFGNLTLQFSSHNFV
jgi:hypothetical protein